MCILPGMARDVQILSVKKDGQDGVMITFSDGTIAGYVAEELLELRPIRERVRNVERTTVARSASPHRPK